MSSGLQRGGVERGLPGPHGTAASVV